MEPPKKKRKRADKAVGSPACLQCRKRHEKCDGGNPCSFCIKSKSVCVYVAPKKRGPRPGYRKKYVDRIEALEKLVREQKFQIAKLTSASANQSTSQAVTVNSLATAGVDMQLMNSTIVFHYVDELYNSEVGGIFPFGVSRNSLDSGGLAVSPYAFQAYTAAALGAFISGNNHHKMQLEAMSKTINHQVSTEPHPYTAAGFSMMAAMYFLCGDVVQSSIYTNLANHQASECKRLLPKAQITNECESLFNLISWHQLKFMKSSVQFEAADALCCRMLEISGGDPNTLSELNKAIYAFCLVMRVNMQMEAVLQSGMMFSATDKTNCVLRLMHAKQITHSCSMFRSELTGVVISAKLKICCGDPTGGYKEAVKVLEQVEQELPHGSPSTSLHCKLLIECFAAVGAISEIVRCVSILQMVGPRWPLNLLVIQSMLDSLNSQHTVDPNEAYIPIFGVSNNKSVAAALLQLKHQGYTLPAVKIPKLTRVEPLPVMTLPVYTTNEAIGGVATDSQQPSTDVVMNFDPMLPTTPWSPADVLPITSPGLSPDLSPVTSPGLGYTDSVSPKLDEALGIVDDNINTMCSMSTSMEDWANILD